MTCLIALSFTLGPFTVALIVNSTGEYDNRWAYRAVFCSQYGFAAISALFVWRMPESPWFLVDKRKDENKALRSLQRLGYKSSTGEDVKRLANIKLTLEQVRRETEGVTYLECFRRFVFLPPIYRHTLTMKSKLESSAHHHLDHTSICATIHRHCVRGILLDILRTTSRLQHLNVFQASDHPAGLVYVRQHHLMVPH